MKHFLMCGSPDHANFGSMGRLPGWVDAIRTACSNRVLAELWWEHEAELTAEAKAAGFVPVAAAWFPRPDQCQRRLLPESAFPMFDDVAHDRDPAREAWSQRFCDEHEY
jgi:hypothetical protein